MAQPSPNVQEVTVYADVGDDVLHDVIGACMERLSPGAFLSQRRLITRASLVESHRVSGTHTTVPFIYQWEAQKADFRQEVENPVPFMRRLACFITDAQHLGSGEVAYAIHCLQIPVLSLVSVGMAGDTASVRVAPVSALEAALFRVPRGGRASAREAIETFLSFPQNPGRMVSVELAGDCHCSPEVLLACCARLQQATSTPVTAIDKNGYPVESGISHHNPPAAFRSLLDKLMRVADDETGPMAAGSFFDLLKAHPQLYGVVEAFNRFGNRGLLRYLIQRGHTLVVQNHVKTSAAVLYDILSKSRDSGNCVDGRDDDAHVLSPEEVGSALLEQLAALVTFEGHWLEMQLPSKRLCFSSPSARMETWTSALQGCQPSPIHTNAQAAFLASCVWLRAGYDSEVTEEGLFCELFEVCAIT